MTRPGFGAFVRDLRLSRGWSQAELARFTNGVLDKHQVSKIESGEHSGADPRVQAALAEALEVPFAEVARRVVPRQARLASKRSSTGRLAAKLLSLTIDEVAELGRDHGILITFRETKR